MPGNKPTHVFFIEFKFIVLYKLYIPPISPPLTIVPILNTGPMGLLQGKYSICECTCYVHKCLSGKHTRYSCLIDITIPIILCISQISISGIVSYDYTPATKYTGIRLSVCLSIRLSVDTFCLDNSS